MRPGLPPAEQGAFYALASEVTHYHFCCILLVIQTNPDSMWEETRSTQGHEYQEARNTGVILESGYHIEKSLISRTYNDQ